MSELVCDGTPSQETVDRWEHDRFMCEEVTITLTAQRRFWSDILDRLPAPPHEYGDIAAMQHNEWVGKIRGILNADDYARQLAKAPEDASENERASGTVGWHLIHEAHLARQVVEVCSKLRPLVHQFGHVVSISDDEFELAGDDYRHRVAWSDVCGVWLKDAVPEVCPHCLLGESPQPYQGPEDQTGGGQG